MSAESPSISDTLSGPAGAPLRLFHGTDHDFAEFRPFSHFGSVEAASTRASADGGKIYSVTLAMQNPLPVEDAGNWSHPNSVKKVVSNTGLLSEAELQHIFSGLDRWGHSNQATMPSNSAIKSELKADPIFAEQDWNKDILWKQRLIKSLERKGYDGFSNTNELEDRGHTSYAIFRSDQVVPYFGKNPEQPVRLAPSVEKAEPQFASTIPPKAETLLPNPAHTTIQTRIGTIDAMPVKRLVGLDWL
jgi:hypothetical protein